MKLHRSLRAEFDKLTGFEVELPPDYAAAFDKVCAHLTGRQLRGRAERRSRLIAHINAKFGFNHDGVARVYAHAASRGVVFNFHEKNLVAAAFDSSSRSRFIEAIRKTDGNTRLPQELLKMFAPIAPAETLEKFRIEISDPSKLRVDKGERPIGNEILLSAFSAFVFSVAEEEIMHEFFDPTYTDEDYCQSYWAQLKKLHPRLYSRERTLDIIYINQSLANECGSMDVLRDSLFAQVESSYVELANHGHLAIWIDGISLEGRYVEWEVCADAMLFAEKHDEVELQAGYFRPKQIEAETHTYLGMQQPINAQFELANEGFTYKDTFVCAPTSTGSAGSERLLLLFQKNKRDETLIACPACRSSDVQGNSYPSLGVRSWECRNPLCPDRSKYNRGKRYSFKALLMQEAIDEEESQIPVDSVKKWSRDVQPGRTPSDAVGMLVRHYSLFGDGVRLFGLEQPNKTLGRLVQTKTRIDVRSTGNAQRFFRSAWFRRYAIFADAAPGIGVKKVERERIAGLTLVHGDSATALATFEPNYFDGAATSPPYFNARDYSHWPNIYCYLHDMQRIAEECFRVLKPGAIYLYNIFDYFDNERSIVFSAMGEKRIILSAYTVDIFRRAGFTLGGSVTWDKGDIEGKRGFNAGNFSPYYQAPFNCWEHILVFLKHPDAAALDQLNRLPAVLRAQPVAKMVRGQNTHGHTAPFPIEVPALLKALIPVDGRVLDPFGGSGTTARAMLGHASETVCIERMEEYCELAKKMYAAAILAQEREYAQGVLFGT